MKTAIEVESRKEGEQIKSGLADPKARALVKIMGALSELPNDRARKRVLDFVNDSLADNETTQG